MLYRDWMSEWLELHVKVSVKEQTFRKYRREAEKYILPSLGDLGLEELTAARLQKFSASLAERGLAAGTVNGVITVLKASLKRATALGVAKRQFSDVIVRPKLREKRVVCFGKEEQRKIERYIFAKRDPKLFGVVLCLYTGLRIGELLALTWEDVDLGRGVLSVTKSCRDCWERGVYVKITDTPKTPDSARVVPVPRQLVGYLREMKRHARCPYVVPGRSECGAQVRTYQRTFGNMLQKLGIAHRGFHALRHTFATRALEVGMDVRTLAELLGHRDPAVTLMRYAHSLIEHKREMMNRVGRLLG